VDGVEAKVRTPSRRVHLTVSRDQLVAFGRSFQNQKAPHHAHQHGALFLPEDAGEF
jgi:hypothetical protein